MVTLVSLVISSEFSFQVTFYMNKNYIYKQWLGYVVKMFITSKHLNRDKRAPQQSIL